MSCFKKSLAAIIFTIWSTITIAIPIKIDFGEVELLGNNYNFSILYDSSSATNQSFNDLNPSLTFTNLSDITNVALTIESLFPNVTDWNPISVGEGLRFFYNLNASTYDYITLVPTSGSGIFGPFNQSRTDGNLFSFAQFVEANPVPSPASNFLFLFGLVGIVLRRKT